LGSALRRLAQALDDREPEGKRASPVTSGTSHNTKEISPEVAGWRRERLPKLPRNEPIRIVPDWVCEILSPTTRRHGSLRKLPYYAKVGVPHLRLVDLEAGVVTVQRLESGKWVTIGAYSDEAEVRIEPFDSVPLNVANWWPPEGSVEAKGEDES
jgi:Uma2 family endonuclease